VRRESTAVRRKWKPGTTTEVSVNLFPKEISFFRRQSVAVRKKWQGVGRSTWHHHRGKREPFPGGD
jgi:hypothetical protein